MPLNKQRLLLSPEEYLEGEKQADLRHEYIAGDIYAMAGAGELHNRIALNLAFQLRAKARGGRCGVFMSDMKLRIKEGVCFYYPDVMLVCDKDDKKSHYKDSPCLIVEVSSPSTESIDYREKLLAYKEISSLKYYLLVSSMQQHVDYYQRDETGDWQSATLELNQIINVQCESNGAQYNADLCLEDIYEDVHW